MKQIQIFDKDDGVFHGFFDATDSETVKNPILMNQVHSADVLFIENKLLEMPSVDALVTKTPNLMLTVKTADCAPVLIFDKKNKIVAAIHAGWKGAFQGVIENTILKMLEVGGDLMYMSAAIGPHIQKKSFISDEKMKSIFPSTEHHFFEPTKKDGEYLFDFHAYVLHRLKRAGIKYVDSIMDDTYTELKYNSYRRDPNNPARQYSVICLKK